ncbi:MAG: hypothetical protein U0V70_05275 [Terriglobia bacterium]
MNRKTYFIIAAIVTLILLLSGSWQAAQAQTIELGTLPGGIWSQGQDLNDVGDVVGMGDNEYGLTHAFVVSTRGQDAFKMIDLGTLGGENSWATDVNNSGIVVGYAELANGNTHAFARPRKLGANVDLGTLPGHVTSQAQGVSDTGFIVGHSGMIDPSTWRPVVWTPDHSGKTWTIHELNTDGLEQVNNWECWAVNNKGQIVGNGFDVVILKYEPVIWIPIKGGKEWKPMKLETTSFYYHGGAGDINDVGEVIGYVFTQDFSLSFPTVWKPSGPRKSPWRLTILPTLSGGNFGTLGNGFAWNEIDGINNKGEMVGASVDSEGQMRAVRWTLSDLNFIEPLGYPGTSSYGRRINNIGVASGWYNDGTYDHGVIERIRSKQKP